jgi:hypothetical protein
MPSHRCKIARSLFFSKRDIALMEMGVKLVALTNELELFNFWIWCL